VSKTHISILLLLLIPGAFHAFIPKVISFGIFAVYYIGFFIVIGYRSYLQSIKDTGFLYILLFNVIYLALHSLFVLVQEVEIIEYARYLLVFILPVLFLPIASSLKKLEDVFYVIKAVILVSSIICIVILINNVLHGSFGRVESGLYFSTMYIFVTILLLGLWLGRINIFSKFEFILIISLHLLRAFIDFRRSPIAIIILGFILIALYLSNTGSAKAINNFFYVVLLLASLWLFMDDVENLLSGLSFYSQYIYRFSLEAFEVAFEVRFHDYFQILSDDNWSRLVGAGLGYNFHTDNNDNIHSLYLFIFTNLGAIGLILMLALTLYPIVVGLKGRSKSPNKKLKTILSLSLFCYFLFFTFSARGSEFESFLILTIVTAIQYKFRYIKLKNHYIK
jgi:hypothetical protein